MGSSFGPKLVFVIRISSFYLGLFVLGFSLSQSVAFLFLTLLCLTPSSSLSFPIYNLPQWISNDCFQYFLCKLGPSRLFLTDMGPTLETRILTFGTRNRHQLLLGSDIPQGITEIHSKQTPSKVGPRELTSLWPYLPSTVDQTHQGISIRPIAQGPTNDGPMTIHTYIHIYIYIYIYESLPSIYEDHVIH